MAPLDTTMEARQVQLTVLQRLTAAERLTAAIEMSNFTHSLAEAGVRLRHRGIAESEIRRQLIQDLYGVGRLIT